MTREWTTTYTWNWMGKLASVDEGESNIATYLYNGDGARVEKMVGGTTTEFLYDSGEVVAEVVGTNVTHYVGLGMDIISQIEGTTRKVFHADGLGSTHALAEAGSGVSGAADYDAWGNILLASLGERYGGSSLLRKLWKWFDNILSDEDQIREGIVPCGCAIVFFMILSALLIPWFFMKFRFH